MKRVSSVCQFLFLVIPTCLLLFRATPTQSATLDFHLTIEAGKRDRANVPVCVELGLPPWCAKAQAVELQSADGKPISAQLTDPGLLAGAPQICPTGNRGPLVARELHFVLPDLKAGQSLTLKTTISDAAQEVKGFSWHDKPKESSELRFGDKPVLRYMCKPFDESTRETRDETYKVYHHLFDSSGKQLVTKGPGGKFPHHRGIFYGFLKCEHDGQLFDTWHCIRDKGARVAGYQLHERTLSTEAGPVLGRQRVEIGWYGSDRKIFAREERELTVYKVPGGQLVEFASRLRSAGGKVKLHGDPQHCGFQFRAANEVAEQSSKQTYFVRPGGKGKPGDARNWSAKETSHANLPWNAMSFVLGSQRYTVAYLDRPANPKPARYCERTYGRFGSDFEYELAEKKPLDISYRIWLQQGEMKTNDVAALSADFVSPVVAAIEK